MFDYPIINLIIHRKKESNITTNKISSAEYIITANVIAQVDLRFGHTTCLSSRNEPFIYPPSALKGLRIFLIIELLTNFFLFVFGLSIGSLATTFSLIGASALIRVILAVVGLLLVFLLTTSPKFKKSAYIFSQIVKYNYIDSSQIVNKIVV